MKQDSNSASSDNNAIEIVHSYLQAMNNDDFEAARKHVTDDLTFEGVLGSRHGAESYFRDMEKMRLKYKVKKLFGDGDDVCVLYDITMQGIDVFGCGWYKLVNGKINWFKVVFDPRPVLELSAKK